MFIIMFRCDQYRWVTKGVYTVRSGGYEFKKRSNAVDNISLKKNEGDSLFRRWEYWGVESYFILHYTGDHSIYTAFQHRSATTNKKPFVRSAPYVKEKVIN